MGKHGYAFLLTVSLIWSQVNFLHAQKEANIWYFGSKAGLDFNSGTPVPLTNGNLITNEGCASISDKNTGQLLFYTDGSTVWNRQRNAMPNGTGLLGNSSSTQSAVAIPKPGNSTQYYVFTVDAQAGVAPSTTGFGGLAYSIVDMTLNGGLGDLSVKNLTLLAKASEKLTAVRHCNGRDIWVLAHQWNSNAFYAYLVTSTGINAPVITNIGTVHQDVGSGTNKESAGYMKLSPDAKKIAVVMHRSLNKLEIFDFDNNTGILSNVISDSAFPPNTSGQDGLYGCSFSPDNSKLYVSFFGHRHPTTQVNSTSYMYQYNMLAGNGAAIISSKTQVASELMYGLGGLQIGPDGKIYVAKFDRNNLVNGFSDYLDVINNPNSLGAACNYSINGQSLGGPGVNQSTLGLPDIVESFLIPQFTATLTYNGCGPNSSVTFIDSTLNGTITTLWNFGDPASGGANTSIQTNASHTYSSPGTYTATLYLTNACKTDTLKQIINIGSLSASINVNSHATCGNNNGSATVQVSGGTGSYTYSWSNLANTATASNLAAGPYSVTVTGTGGCSATAGTTINQSGNIVISATATNTSCGTNNGTAKVNVTTGTATGYNWNNLAQTDSISGLAAGTYTVTVTGSGGCSATASVTVSGSSSGPITITSDKSIMCSGDSAMICAPTGFTTYQWNTGQSGRCIYTKLAGNYYATASDNGGCTVESNHLAISIHPIPSVSIIVQGDTLSSFGATSYQWYFNGTAIPGATSAVHIAKQSGNYTVKITDNKGCTATSSAVAVTKVGIADISVNRMVKIYPNPVSDGNLQMEVSKELIGSEYEMFDALGQLVGGQVIRSNRTEIDISILSSGVYFIKVAGTTTKLLRN